MKWWLVAVAVAGCGESGNAPVDAAVGGDVACIATLAAVPASASFGMVTPGMASAATTLSITNAGTCASSPVAVSITGADAASFEIGSTTCAGHALAPAESCAVAVTFRPPLPGARSAILRIDGGASAVLVPLDGMGAVSDPLTINPSSRTFAATHVGETSAPLGFTVTNTGGWTGGVPNIMVSGADAGEFTITTNTCAGAGLPPAGTCVIEFALRPTSAGTKSASFTYEATSLGQTGGLVSGSALPGLALAPAMYDFGVRAIPTASAPQRFTLTNLTTVSSSATLAASVTGADAAQFSIAADTCSAAVLSASGTCTIDVVFQPTTPGARAAMLHVVDSKLGMIDVALAGTGLAAAPAMLAISPTSKDFGSASVGTTTTAATFTVTNTGDAPTSMVTAAVTGPFQIVTDTCSGSPLAAHASCTIDARFAPTMLGATTGTLAATATTGGQATASLTGTAISTVTLQITPPAFDFGSAYMLVKTFTVTNIAAARTGAIAVTLGGANPGTFAIQNDQCAGVLLDPGATCTFDVKTTCNPPFGNTSATVTLSAIPGGMSTLSLTASILGKSCSSVTSVTPTSAQYGDQTVGTTGSAQTFSFSDFGGQPTPIVTVVLSGANASDFVLSNDTCTGTSLPVGGAPCTVDVAFAPGTAGAKQATITLGGTSSGVASLTGTGVSGPPVASTPMTIHGEGM